MGLQITILQWACYCEVNVTVSHWPQKLTLRQESPVRCKQNLHQQACLRRSNRSALPVDRQ